MPPHLTAEQWCEDLDHLAGAIRRQHRHPFHSVSSDAFGSAVRALDARIPSLAAHEVTVELARLVALIGDGHTALRLSDVSTFRRYPLTIERYSDGLAVRAVVREHATAAGVRLLAIDGMPAWEAYEAMRPLISRDNEMGVWAVAPELLTIPEVLHARGVVEDMAQASFTVELRGGERTELLHPIERLASDLVDASDGAVAPTPLWLTRSPEENGFDFVPEDRALYMAFNRVRDGADESLAAFFDRAFALIEREAVERLIIDIRLNHGGDNRLNRPLVHHLIRRDGINRWGALFVIIGRRTFSAAMNLAVDLEHHTRALFVGESTGSSPNHYGEDAEAVLPRSGLRATASALWWQSSEPYDDRPWIAPAIPARLSAEDYVANRDPALEAALRYSPGTTRFTEYPDRLARKLRRDDPRRSPNDGGARRPGTDSGNVGEG